MRARESSTESAMICENSFIKAKDEKKTPLSQKHLYEWRGENKVIKHRLNGREK